MLLYANTAASDKKSANRMIEMLKIPSDPSQITRVEEYLKRVTDYYPRCEDKYPDMLISLTEAVNNAIIHGNKGCDQKYVEIEVVAKERGLAFLVSDEGAGFDPTAIPDPTSAEKVGCCGGRGVFIMQHLSDKIRFTNAGRTVEMFFEISES